MGHCLLSRGPLLLLLAIVAYSMLASDLDGRLTTADFPYSLTTFRQLKV